MGSAMSTKKPIEIYLSKSAIESVVGFDRAIVTVSDQPFPEAVHFREVEDAYTVQVSRNSLIAKLAMRDSYIEKLEKNNTALEERCHYFIAEQNRLNWMIEKGASVTLLTNGKYKITIYERFVPTDWAHVNGFDTPREAINAAMRIKP